MACSAAPCAYWGAWCAPPTRFFLLPAQSIPVGLFSEPLFLCTLLPGCAPPAFREREGTGLTLCAEVPRASLLGHLPSGIERYQTLSTTDKSPRPIRRGRGVLGRGSGIGEQAEPGVTYMLDGF